MTVTTLLKYVRAFPRMEKEDEFFSQLVDVIIGQDELKKAISNLSWAAEKVSALQRRYLSDVRRAPNIDGVAQSTKQFYGRFASVIKQVDKDLKFCQKSRDMLRLLPTVDPNCRDRGHSWISGNVGKSQLIEKISTAKPAIAPYPFTTKGIGIGHLKSGWRTLQVIDTPGLLDRELEERNAIELQAILALRYLGDIIVFVIDPTETCGYTMDRQNALLDSVRKNFGDIPIIEVENKVDMGTAQESNRIRISALTGEGVDALVQVILDTLKEERKKHMNELPA